MNPDIISEQVTGEFFLLSCFVEETIMRCGELILDVRTSNWNSQWFIIIDYEVGFFFPGRMLVCCDAVGYVMFALTDVGIHLLVTVSSNYLFNYVFIYYHFFLQLRNLVWATSKHDVYLMSHYSVIHWSALTSEKTEVLNVSGHVTPCEVHPVCH